MGAEGARIFVPPLVDPMNPNLDPMIVRGINHIGAEMALALEERGKSGVGDGVIYDLWWHGGARSTPTRHNMVGRAHRGGERAHRDADRAEASRTARAPARVCRSTSGG